MYDKVMYMSKQMTVYVDDVNYEKFSKEAARLDRSVNWLFSKAIDDYFTNDKRSLIEKLVGKENECAELRRQKEEAGKALQLKKSVGREITRDSGKFWESERKNYCEMKSRYDSGFISLEKRYNNFVRDEQSELKTISFEDYKRLVGA